MTKLFPLAIAALVLTLAGPMAVEWVGGMTLDLTAQTVTQMQEAGQ
jgi:hypothetical protein